MGSRIKLRYTRSIITAIHSGELAARRRLRRPPIFELQVRAQVIVSKPAGTAEECTVAILPTIRRGLST